jgi:hypothetical protein
MGSGAMNPFSGSHTMFLRDNGTFRDPSELYVVEVDGPGYPKMVTKVYITPSRALMSLLGDTALAG